MDDKILLGLSRLPEPPDTKYIDEDGKVQFAEILRCPCGHDLWYREAVAEHWRMGHFDTPIYATRQEMIDRALEKGLLSSK